MPLVQPSLRVVLNDGGEPCEPPYDVGQGHPLGRGLHRVMVHLQAALAVGRVGLDHTVDGLQVLGICLTFFKNVKCVYHY